MRGSPGTWPPLNALLEVIMLSQCQVCFSEGSDWSLAAAVVRTRLTEAVTERWCVMCACGRLKGRGVQTSCDRV